jgi:hypothetical protein
MKPRLDAKTRRGLALMYCLITGGCIDYWGQDEKVCYDRALKYIALKAGYYALENVGLDAGLILSWDE